MSTQDVVAEELSSNFAARGIAGIRLEDPFSAPSLTGSAVAERQARGRSPLAMTTFSQGDSRQPVSVAADPHPPREVQVEPGSMRFLCRGPAPVAGGRGSMELSLASLCASCPRLLAGRSIVEMQAGVGPWGVDE